MKRMMKMRKIMKEKDLSQLQTIWTFQALQLLLNFRRATLFFKTCTQSEV
ncbi:hypothetical protein Mgra_00009204, partial [Meloidogyne graminicola]